MDQARVITAKHLQARHAPAAWWRIGEIGRVAPLVRSIAANTDAAVLAKEAANFERISGELKGVISHVEATAGALASQMVGQAGTAAQSALVRYSEAAARQIQELNDISANIHTSGTQYTATDDDQAANFAATMGI